jgi:hypothetical protein
MTFFDLNDDGKSIIAKHLTNDYIISTIFMSNYYDLQKILFGDIVCDNDFHTIKKIRDDVKDDNDFYNGNIYIRYLKISMMYYLSVPIIYWYHI